MKTRFLKDTGMVVCAEGVAGIAAMAYQMIIARGLGRSDYGLFQALMGSFGLLMIIGVPLNLAVSHCVASSDSVCAKRVAGACIRASILLGMIPSIVIIVLVQPVASLLRSPSVLPVLCLACLAVARATILGFFGVLHGNNLYRSFAVVRMVEPLVCLLCGVSLIAIGAGVTGALAGYLAGMICIIMVFVLKCDIYEFPGAKLKVVMGEFRSIVNILVVFATLFFVSDFPAIVARMRLDSDDAGLYGGLYMLRHTLLPFCSAVCYPLYSHTVSRTPERWLLLKSLCVVLLLCSGFMVVAATCPALVLRILLGEQFVEGAVYMFDYGIALTLQMISMTLMLYLTATGRLCLPLLVLPTAAFLVCLWSTEPTIENLVRSQTVTWLVLLSCVGLQVSLCSAINSMQKTRTT